MLNRLLDWLNPERVWLRNRKLQRYQIQEICKLLGSPEEIARSFVSLVDNELWTTEWMCEMLTLVPAEKYTAVKDAIENILKKREGDR